MVKNLLDRNTLTSPFLGTDEVLALSETVKFTEELRCGADQTHTIGPEGKLVGLLVICHDCWISKERR